MISSLLDNACNDDVCNVTKRPNCATCSLAIISISTRGFPPSINDDDDAMARDLSLISSINEPLLTLLAVDEDDELDR